MLTFSLSDRIKETSRIEGTGNIPLDGAAPGFSSFDDFYASGDVVFYAITDNVKYEVGSGVYKMSGSSRVLTRNPIRSSDMNSGPWYVDGETDRPFPQDLSGFFYPLWLSRSAAISGVGLPGGPHSSVSGINFKEFPGQTFYYIPDMSALGVNSLAGSGENFNLAARPVSFTTGLKEVFVTYPGKTSVYTGYGLASGLREPNSGGIAFWHNEQLLNYDPDLVWNDDFAALGIGVANPTMSIDARGFIRGSGFIENGSGVLFAGGNGFSGGKQLEPFLRNQLGNAADGVIELSGLVNQFIGFAKQSPSTVFAGPIPGCETPPCDPDYPSFRMLVLDDLPLNSLSGLFQGFIPGAASGVIFQDSHYIFDQTFIPDATSGVIYQDGHYIFDENVLPDATSGVIYQDDHYIFDETLIPGAESGIILQDNHYVFDQTLIPGAESGVILQDNHYIFDSSLIPTIPDPLSATSGLKTQDDVYIMDPSGTGNLAILNFPSSKIVMRGGSFSPDSTWTGGEGSVIIGSGAGLNLASSSDDFVIAIGHQALNGSVTGDRTGCVAIGQNAMNTTTEGSGQYGVGIGYNALSSTVGNFSVGIGYEAGSAHQNTDGGQSVSIGYYAGYQNSFDNRNIAIGTFSLAGSGGEFAINNRSSVAVGVNAGFYSKTNSNGVMIGTSAGENASGLFDCVFLGFNAGASVSGYVGASGLGPDGRCPSLVAIGKDALLSGVNMGQVVAIGDYAGATSSGLFHSVLIGRGAGYGRSGRNSIIISNRSALLPDYDANWAPSDQIEVLDIGRSIQGLMGFSDSSRDVRMHIGLPLASGTYRDSSMLDLAALNVTPGTAARSALVLYANPTNQTQALMRTEMASLAGSISGRLNEIVNSEGMLSVPVATGVSGSDIISQNGYIIPTGQGVIAGWNVGSEKGIAICVGGTWYKVSGVPV